MRLRGNVFAVEPISPLADRIIAAAKDKPQVKVFVDALSNEHRLVEFNYSTDKPWLSSLADRDLNAHKNVSRITVGRFILDDLPSGKIDFIRLDLEGGEYHALLGAARIMRLSRPVIAFAHGRYIAGKTAGYSRDDFFGLFAARGYEFLNLFGRPYTDQDYSCEWNDRFIPHYLAASPKHYPIAGMLRDHARSLSASPQDETATPA